VSDSEFRFAIPMESLSTERSFGGPLAILSRLKAKALDIVESTLDQYKVGGLKLPTKEVFMAKASELYDTLCAAVDIPGLGPVAEQALEQVMKPAFLKACEFAYDRFAPA